jgi:hypothetical protein
MFQGWKTTRLYLKKKTNSKRPGSVAQEVEHLPTKCKALSSDSSTAKKKKKIVTIVTTAHVGKDKEKEFSHT